MFRHPELTTEPRNVSWDEFMQNWTWKQGEHVTLIGPTGQGKTTLARELINAKRDYVVVFVTKRKDGIIPKFRKDGFRTVDEFDGNPVLGHKLLLRPKRGGTIRQTLTNQAKEFQHAMETAYDVGNWCVFIDEAKVVCDDLKLQREVEMLLQQGRSLGVSVVMGVQRPVKVPLAAYDQATHLFFWRDNDEQNLKRIGGLGGMDAKAVRAAVSVLRSHEVLYLNTRNGTMVTTKAKVR